MVTSRFSFLLFISFWFTSSFCDAFAQTLNSNYSPLKSAGSIPAEFTNRTKRKVEEDLKLVKGDDRAESRLKRNYLFHANYAIDQNLHGGNIILNDEISVFVNKVVDELLIKDPQLRKELKVFVTKLPDLNASCMGKGYLFVNLGLLARVENEAQLAYILSHEIAHYVKEHNYKSYSFGKKNEKEYKKRTFEDRILQELKYSKENESEADVYGFEILKNSSYSVAEVIPAMNMMKYDYLPFEEIPFSENYFDDQFYRIPKTYFLPELQGVMAAELYDDTKSTHPNIAKRKESILKLLEGETKTGAKFIVSEDLFFRIRDLSRFEIARLYLVERNYFDALFSTYILKKKFPDNEYLNEVMCKSLYAMTLYKWGDLKYNDDSYQHGPIPDFTKTEGYSQQLNFVLDKLPPIEMAILALRNSWENHKKFPEKVFYSAVSDSLFKIIVSRGNRGIGEFYKRSDTIKITSENYWRYAFADLLESDSEFVKKFHGYSALIPENESAGLKVYVPQGKRPKKEKPKLVKDSVPKYDIRKVIVLDPSYLRYDETLSETGVYSATDIRKENLIYELNKNAKINNIGILTIDPENFLTDQIQLYNDFSVMNDWYNERMEGGEIQNCPVLNTNEIDRIVKEYGSKYFLWPVVVGVRLKDGLVNKDSFTYYYSLLFDVETGKVISSVERWSDKNDNVSRINDYVDDTFDAIRKLNGQ